MQTIFEVPYLKVNPSSTIQYSLLEDGNGNVIRTNINKEEEEQNLRNNNHEGFLSKKAKKRLADCVDWINELTSWKTMKVDEKTVKYKLTFMTLTLPSEQYNDVISEKAGKLMLKDIEAFRNTTKSMINYIDDVIKKECLNQFLTELRQVYGMKLYIWRAEAQKNGNIHFHIITDVGIHYKTVRAIWNRILSKVGYIDVYRNNHKDLTVDQYREKYPVRFKFKGKTESEAEYNTRTQKAFDYGNKTSWRDPNSTDIHPVRKIKELQKYVTKYLCKEVDPFEDRLIFGRLWFISQALSEARNMTDLVTNDIDNEIDMISEARKDRTFKTEHCFILQLSVHEIEELGGKLISKIFYEKLKYLKGLVYDSQKET